ERVGLACGAGDGLVEDQVRHPTGLRPHREGEPEPGPGLVRKPPAGLVDQDRPQLDERRGDDQVARSGEERRRRGGAETAGRGAGLAAEAEAFARGRRAPVVWELSDRGAVLPDERVIADEAAAGEEDPAADRLPPAPALRA